MKYVLHNTLLIQYSEIKKRDFKILSILAEAAYCLKLAILSQLISECWIESFEFYVLFYSIMAARLCLASYKLFVSMSKKKKKNRQGINERKTRGSKDYSAPKLQARESLLLATDKWPSSGLHSKREQKLDFVKHSLINLFI